MISVHVVSAECVISVVLVAVVKLLMTETGADISYFLPVIVSDAQCSCFMHCNQNGV